MNHSMSDYRTTVEALYAEAAVTANASLCCTQTPPWQLPGLVVPKRMLAMNYGCGTTVHPRDLARVGKVLYVGVGAGLEALQLAYFVRKTGGVIAVDKVEPMLNTARELLEEAAESNDWFDPAFVELKLGDALDLPVETASIDFAAQNCLFNIFTREHLADALAEMHRVLRVRGKLSLSDPISTMPLPTHVAADPRLRAECMTPPTLDEYLMALVAAGFGTIEVRGRRPYRVLDKMRYGLREHILLESVEVVAIKDPIPDDGPCIFTGRAAVYVGGQDLFDDGAGHVLKRDIPLGICDKTAALLARLERDDLVLTPSTWHYSGDGCC
ncbi:MAG: arsenosugar biosynthesis arsenite methyltransferase ArsM [Planctomycetota bacterium]|nr:arsenosugar biosynthesis arsenite methyltransferase ArsM [Planctomycetota bacterium]